MVAEEALADDDGEQVPIPEFIRQAEQPAGEGQVEARIEESEVQCFPTLLQTGAWEGKQVALPKREALEGGVLPKIFWESPQIGVLGEIPFPLREALGGGGNRSAEIQ